MAVQAGQDVGSYHIIEALGQGGIATVYKAYDMRLERQVAVKFIRMDMILPVHLEEVLKRFEREARALVKFMHPNIVPVYGYGEHEGAPYLVMGYLPGGSVKALTGKPMPYDRAARLLAPVARALEYAHGKNIIHCDVKPGNILMTEKGIPMLSDFGIAKILGAEKAASLTGTGGMVGTPEYMAPEQWEGKVAPQTDIYSLGVVFYELVTGRKPYTADTPVAIHRKQLTEPLPRPRSFVPDLPEEVEQVLYKALAKDIKNRYASMRDFAGVLERLTSPPTPLLKGEGSRTSPPVLLLKGEGGRVGDVGRLVQPVIIQVPTARDESETFHKEPQRSSGMHAAGVRSAWLWAGIGIVALLLVIAGIVTQGFGLLKIHPIVTQAGTQAALQASLQGATTTQPAVTDTAALRSTPTPTPTGTATLAPTPTPSSPATLALPVREGTPVPQPLTAISPQNAGRVVALARWNHVAAGFGVAFSPDGKTLANGTWSNTVKLWRVADGSLLSTLHGHTDWVGSVAFSPDGKTLASGSYDKTVKLWRVSDGSLLFTLQGHTNRVYGVAFSPDGTLLASGSTDDTVKLWRVSDGSLLSTLTEHIGGVSWVAFSPDGRLLASVSDDDMVKLWRVSDGSLLSTLKGHTSGVNGVAFSPDGKTLASGSDDYTVRLWRVSDSSLLFTLQGHTDAVWSVAFSPDGTLLASGGVDKTVKLWRVSDGSLLSTLKGHISGVLSVTFSPDGTLIASGSEDDTIRLWGVP